MSFKDMVAADNTNVFMNLDEFAETHDIRYDGVTYPDVSCTITKLKETERPTKMRDHGQGIYLVSAIFHCPLASLDGNVPEKGTLFGVSDGDFIKDYYVAESSCAMGMIRLELEARDE